TGDDGRVPFPDRQRICVVALKPDRVYLLSRHVPTGDYANRQHPDTSLSDMRVHSLLTIPVRPATKAVASAHPARMLNHRYVRYAHPHGLLASGIQNSCWRRSTIGRTTSAE